MKLGKAAVKCFGLQLQGLFKGFSDPFLNILHLHLEYTVSKADKKNSDSLNSAYFKCKTISWSVFYLCPTQGKVCGLCGNFDGNSKNDFKTRSMCLVEDVKVFRDSWKISSDCPEVYISKEPCAIHPYRMPWAHKMCYIIKSDVFAQCHAEVLV